MSNDLLDIVEAYQKEMNSGLYLELMNGLMKLNNEEEDRKMKWYKIWTVKSLIEMDYDEDTGPHFIVKNHTDCLNIRLSHKEYHDSQESIANHGFTQIDNQMINDLNTYHGVYLADGQPSHVVHGDTYVLKIEPVIKFRISLIGTNDQTEVNTQAP